MYPIWGNDTSSLSMMQAAPNFVFRIQAASRTFTTNQPSVTGARPYLVSSSRASSTRPR